jgi:glycosyltransferase involved in cell wall biosynthesis
MPLGVQRGGAEMMLQQLLAHRATARIHPTVAFLEDGPLVEWSRRLPVAAQVIEAGRLRQLCAYGRAVRALGRLARAIDAQLVLGWMPKGHLYGGPAAAMTGRRAAWLQAGLPTGTAAIDRAATAVPAAGVLTVSRAGDAAQRALRPRRPTHLVHPGVDIERFDARRVSDRRSVRTRLGLPIDAPIFGSVGRFERMKGFDVILDAAALLRSAYPDACCVLVGAPHPPDAGYVDELRSRARRLGLDGNVVFAGHQDDPETWMQAMDVFVLASHNEPFGMVVIEAMALGKPVVATAEGGPTDVITSERQGTLVPWGDARALSCAVARFVADQALRDRVGAAARLRAQAFSAQSYAAQMGDVLAELATRRQAGTVSARARRTRR